MLLQARCLNRRSACAEGHRACLFPAPPLSPTRVLSAAAPPAQQAELPVQCAGARMQRSMSCPQTRGMHEFSVQRGDDTIFALSTAPGRSGVAGKLSSLCLCFLSWDSELVVSCSNTATSGSQQSTRFL